MSQTAEYIKQAYRHAWVHSDDPRTKVGAVIVDRDGLLLFRDCNHFPRGICVTVDRQAPDQKSLFMIHAEEAAVLHAAHYGVKLAGKTMYANWAACLTCARSIIDAGIVRVVSHQEFHDRAGWKDDIAKADELLQEAGVQHEYWSGRIGGVRAMTAGMEWEP